MKGPTQIRTAAYAYALAFASAHATSTEWTMIRYCHTLRPRMVPFPAPGASDQRSSQRCSDCPDAREPVDILQPEPVDSHGLSDTGRHPHGGEIEHRTPIHEKHVVIAGNFVGISTLCTNGKPSQPILRIIIQQCGGGRIAKNHAVALSSLFTIRE